MATKSIYKNVSIKNRSLGKDLVLALENAKGKKNKEVILSKKCQNIGKDKIKELFG